MRKVLRLFSAVALVLSIAACSAGSGRINWDNARQVKAGMSKQEVASLMGQPMRVVGKPDNSETWIWVHVNGMTMASQSASISFKDGKTTSAIPVPDSF